jgi:hypothetical protein
MPEMTLLDDEQMVNSIHQIANKLRKTKTEISKPEVRTVLEAITLMVEEIKKEVNIEN